MVKQFFKKFCKKFVKNFIKVGTMGGQGRKSSPRVEIFIHGVGG